MIRWEGVDRDNYERAVWLLLSRLHKDVQSLDGAGGEGGKDAVLVTGDGLTVFEAKSFSSRLTSGQKRQIKPSLRRAVANAPGRRRWERVGAPVPSAAPRAKYATLASVATAAR